MALDLRLLLQSRIFTFGEYSTHAYGSLRFDGDSLVVGSYLHPRETFYRLIDRGLEFLCADGFSVTARLELVQERPLLFHGSTVGLSNCLYLRETLAFHPRSGQLPTTLLRPAVLINTVPKSGTYFLQLAFQELGFRPTDLHLGNAFLHDNRNLLPDVGIHRNPQAQEVSLAVDLLPPLLPFGSVTVGHIDDRSVLQAFMDANVFLLLVVRDLRDVLWSLFRFKLAVVDPLDDADRRWRSCPLPEERFMGFLVYYWSRDILHIANCLRAFFAFGELPVLRYEDLLAGALPEPTERQLEERLQGCGGVAAFLAALAAARDAPTSTLSRALPGMPVFTAEEEQQIRRLIHALVAGTCLAEVNALFGYH